MSTARTIAASFGRYGGQYVAETLSAPLEELDIEFERARADSEFRAQLHGWLTTFAGRPTPLTFAKRLTERTGGASIYLKREDLNHTGAHKLNNCLGQVLLAKRLNRTRIVAETGAGQHGVAVASACAPVGLKCVVYMGAKDVARQSPNVRRMQLLGADVRPVESGHRTLKDAINEAVRDWLAYPDTTHYLLGSVVGPAPYPTIVRYFQSIIGSECVIQFKNDTGRKPDCVVACVGGGSNSIGIFSAFIDDPKIRLVGVQAAGRGIAEDAHAAPLLAGTVGFLHGCCTYVMQDENGQILDTHSIAPGLDYPAVGPEHSFLKDTKRVEYTSATDDEALRAFELLSRTEGIIPALESAHAVAIGLRLARQMERDQAIVINISGRGDKDLDVAVNALSRLENDQ